MAQATFYCVTDGSEAVKRTNNYRLLQEACAKRNVAFVELVPPPEAYAIADVPQAQPGGLYRLKTTTHCSQFAYALRLKNPQLKTWYPEQPQGIGGGNIPWLTSIRGEHDDLAVIPMLFGVTGTVNDALIERINSRLHGFPVVLKKTGGSHGSGVMIIDTPESLKTVMAHVIGDAKDVKYVLKQFIRQATHYRVVVLDGACISAIKYLPQKGDIRTNAVKKPAVRPVSLPDDLAKLAVEAVENEGVVFGGVDILVDEDGKAYIAEVNTPCNFSRNQNCTGDDIAGALVEYLALKN